MRRPIAMLLATFAALCVGVVQASAENACPNPGFELLNPAGDNFPLNWGTGKDPSGASGPVIDKEAHSGAIAVRLSAPSGGRAWINSDPIAIRRGTLRFHYKAVRSGSDGANLTAYAIVLDAASREITRTGTGVPKEHVGDGQWHQASFDFDFTAHSQAASVLVAVRVNEGGPSREGEWLVDDFELAEVRIGPRPVFEALYMPKPVMLTGKPAELVVQATNTGDEIVPASTVRLRLPDTVHIVQGSLPAEVDVPELAPGDSRRMVWSVAGQDRGEFDISAEWVSDGKVMVSRTRHGVCVVRPNNRELCTRGDGYWRFFPKTTALQEGSGEPLRGLRTLKSRDLPDSHIGITAHIPRSRDMERIFEPEHLIDGDYSTSWSGRGHETECPGAVDWAQVDFRTAAEIREVRLVPYWNSQCFPVDFDVKLRKGDRWVTVHEARRVRVQPEDGQGSKKPYVIALDQPMKADAVRVDVTRFGTPTSFFTDFAATYYFRISELEAVDAAGANAALATAGARASVSWTFRSFYNSAEEVRNTYPELYSIGVKWNRIGQWGDWTCWYAVEPEKGKYYIDPETDRAITESVENGVNILYTLDYGNPVYEETQWLTDPGPVWRHGHPFTGDGGPTKLRTIRGFVNYARFVAKHFRGRVKYYEIWNEENSWAWYGSPPDPKAFGTLLRETAKALKEIDPEIKVMVGGTAALAPAFISESLDEGGGRYLDAIGFHPYTMPYPEMGLGALDVVNGKQVGRDKSEFGYTTYREMLEFYRKTFAKYNPSFEFWANEWNAIPTREDSPYKGLSEIQESKQVARFFLMATLTGVRAVWWSLANRNTVYDWGVLRTEDLSRKPAYYTIQAMCTLLSGAKPDASVTVRVTGDAPELMCEPMRGRDGETLIALWCATNPVDEFAARRVSLSIGGAKVRSAEAVDTLHAITQKLNLKREGGVVVLDGLLATDYPVIVRLR